jgi:hypothetical protein
MTAFAGRAENDQRGWIIGHDAFGCRYGGCAILPQPAHDKP